MFYLSKEQAPSSEPEVLAASLRRKAEEVMMGVVVRVGVVVFVQQSLKWRARWHSMQSFVDPACVTQAALVVQTDTHTNTAFEWR